MIKITTLWQGQAFIYWCYAFHPHCFVWIKTYDIFSRHYEILYPGQAEYRLARKLRCSPIHSEQEARGAVFGTRMGFERPLYYDNMHKGNFTCILKNTN